MLEELKNCDHVIFVSDTHFGVRANTIEWLEIQKDYFYNFFIPLLREKKKEHPDLVLFHLGDVFDNRQSLNLLVMNTALDIFLEMSKILPVFIILGNHDLYKKTQNDVNSVKILKFLPGVTVFEEPEVIRLKHKSFLMMPWRASHEDEKKCMSENSADYLCCHTDIQGAQFSRFVQEHQGNEIDDFSKFARIFSGHIHYRQRLKNVELIGSPYQLTRSDAGNEKCVYVFTPSTDSLEVIWNNYSPKFLKFQFDDLLEMSYDQINHAFKNNFVDVVADVRWSTNFSFNVFLESLTTARRVSFSIASPTLLLESTGEEEFSSMDFLEISNQQIESLTYNDNVKLLVKKLFFHYYKKSLELKEVV